MKDGRRILLKYYHTPHNKTQQNAEKFCMQDIKVRTSVFIEIFGVPLLRKLGIDFLFLKYGTHGQLYSVNCASSIKTLHARL